MQCTRIWPNSQAEASTINQEKKSMYSIASSSADISTMFTNTGLIIAATIGTVLVGYVALLGLGFAVRHGKKYITGRKF